MSSDRFGPALPPSMSQPPACEVLKRESWMQGVSSEDLFQAGTFTSKDMKKQKVKEKEKSPEYDYSAPGLHVVKKSTSKNKRLFSNANKRVSDSKESKRHIEKMKARFREKSEDDQSRNQKSKSKNHRFQAPVDRDDQDLYQKRKDCFKRSYQDEECHSQPSRSERKPRSPSKSPSRKDQNPSSRSKSPRYSRDKKRDEMSSRSRRQPRSRSQSPKRSERRQKSISKSPPHRSKDKKVSLLRGENDSRSLTINSNEIEQPKQEEELAVVKNQIEKLVTDDDLNKLSAKILKAEISGNSDKVAKLSKKLEEMKAALKAQPVRSSETRSETVILTKTDSKGNIRPVVDNTDWSNHDHRGKRRKKEKITKTHDDSGERDQYFPDDKKKNLSDLLHEERAINKLGQDQLFMKYAGKLSKMSSDRQNWTIDDMFESNIAKEKSTGFKDMEKLKSASQKEHKQLESCHLCLDKCSKESIIHLGKTLYIKVPHVKSMTKYQCQIVPVDHMIASVNGDEDFLDELRNVKSSLVKGFASKNLDTIFLESAQHLGRRKHIVIDCIPVPMDDGALLPAYFKKEILDCDVEWAQNKKLIDTRKKSLKKSIPQGLPFFSVEFGTDGGFAHVIEDERLFKRYFGLQIVGGVLDCDVSLWRNPGKETAEGLQYKKRVFEKLAIEF